LRKVRKLLINLLFFVACPGVVLIRIKLIPLGMSIIIECLGFWHVHIRKGSLYIKI
jgi:hypothetical protein